MRELRCWGTPRVAHTQMLLFGRGDWRRSLSRLMQVIQRWRVP